MLNGNLTRSPVGTDVGEELRHAGEQGGRQHADGILGYRLVVTYPADVVATVTVVPGGLCDGWGGLFAANYYLPVAGQADVEQPVSNTSRSGESINSSDLPRIENLQNSFNSVVEQVLPAVVQVNVTQTIVQNVPSFGGFPWFFGTPESREYDSESLGSGVMFRREGDTYYVLTNDHVAGEANKIEVVLYDERTFPAELVGTDTRRDIAVISFSTKDRDIKLAPMGNSSDLKVGDWVLAMGSPYGFYSSVTAGIVSALGRSGKEINNLNDHRFSWYGKHP